MRLQRLNFVILATALPLLILLASTTILPAAGDETAYGDLYTQSTPALAPAIPSHVHPA